MQRIEALPVDTDLQPAAELFGEIKKQMGGVPNIFRTIGNSPAALEGFLSFSGALGKGKLSGAERELIALAAAGANNCDYCASAHTTVGGMQGLDKAEMSAALAGGDLEGRKGALTAITHKIVTQRGELSDADIAEFKAAGFDSSDLVEVIANTALNLFTNYFNHIAATEIDFPVVSTKEAVAA